MVQRLRLHLPVGGTGLIPGGGAKISYAPVAKKPKQKNRNNIIINSIKTFKKKGAYKEIFFKEKTIRQRVICPISLNGPHFSSEPYLTLLLRFITVLQASQVVL